MVDQVRVIFIDRTETVIYVGEDDSIQGAVAALADELGVEVLDYRIEDTHDEEVI